MKIILLVFTLLYGYVHLNSSVEDLEKSLDEITDEDKELLNSEASKDVDDFMEKNINMTDIMGPEPTQEDIDKYLDSMPQEEKEMYLNATQESYSHELGEEELEKKLNNITFNPKEQAEFDKLKIDADSAIKDLDKLLEIDLDDYNTYKDIK